MVTESGDVRDPRDFLDDPATSDWLRHALRTALDRDPVEAANDADLLRTLLFRWALEAAESGDAVPSARDAKVIREA